VAEGRPIDQRAIGKRADYLRFETPVRVYPDCYEAIVADARLVRADRNGRMPDDVNQMM
jgi:hypothetical protein